MSTLNLQVGASTDDAIEHITTGATVTVSVFTPRFGDYGGYGHNGLRFTGVSGLSGATINTATLTFRAMLTTSGSFIGDWYAEDAAAPTTFVAGGVGSNDITDRTPTAATCEGDSVDFGNWTAGSDYEFTGDGVNTIADIIQELADSYDPSAIALLHIYISGAGERVAKSYDSDPALATKLDIDYTVGAQVDVYPSAVPITYTIPTPTFEPGEANFTPSAVVYSWTILEPSVVAGVGIFPSAVPFSWTIPTPTWSCLLTITPDAVAYTWTILAPDVTIGVVVKPDAVPIAWTIPTPTFTPGLANFTPDALAYSWTIPTPSVSTVGVTYTIFGEVTREIDPADFPDGAAFYFEVVIQTSSAAVPVYAQLFNVSTASPVANSEISSVSTEPERKRSSALSLPSGSNVYRAKFGGEPGGFFIIFYGGIVVETD